MAFGKWRGGIAIVALSGDVAHAEPGVGERLSALRASQSYQRTIVETVQGTSAYRAVACDAAKIDMIGPTYVLTDPSFDAKGAPRVGDWAERIVVRGCGPDHAFNVLTHVKDGTVASEPLLPGSTQADLRLQMDAISFAFDAAPVDRKGCRPIYVLDTAFQSFFAKPNPTIKDRPWSEVWTVVQCDTRKQVDMTFVPDATGTAISAQASP